MYEVPIGSGNSFVGLRLAFDHVNRGQSDGCVTGYSPILCAPNDQLVHAPA